MEAYEEVSGLTSDSECEGKDWACSVGSSTDIGEQASSIAGSVDSADSDVCETGLEESAAQKALGEDSLLLCQLLFVAARVALHRVFSTDKTQKILAAISMSIIEFTFDTLHDHIQTRYLWISRFEAFDLRESLIKNDRTRCTSFYNEDARRRVARAG